MNKTLLIAKQELAYLFRSPLAWIIVGIILALSAWFFLNIVERFQQVAHELMNMPRPLGVTGFIITPFYSNVSIFFLMIVPILAMHSFQRERWNGRMTILESAPLSNTQIVLGKFLGLAFFLFVLVALLSLMPLSLKFGAPIDLRTVFLCILGLWLLLCSFAAITLFLTVISKEVVIAIALSFGVLFLLRMLDWGVDQAATEMSTLEYLSNFRHFSVFIKGFFSPVSFMYFVLTITLFLGLAVRHLNFQRERA